MFAKKIRKFDALIVKTILWAGLLAWLCSCLAGCAPYRAHRFRSGYIHGYRAATMAYENDERLSLYWAGVLYGFMQMVDGARLKKTQEKLKKSALLDQPL